MESSRFITIIINLYHYYYYCNRPQLDKKAILESYDLAILALDEIIDRGLVLETDAKEVLGKISLGTARASAGGVSLGDHLNEQSISTAFQMAKEQMKTFLR